jgi:hypothetical protein
VKNTLYIFWFLFMAAFILSGCQRPAVEHSVLEVAPAMRDVWSREQSNEWYKQRDWLCGADFIPSTAVNQLEMWQAETFDTVTIDRELGFAESIGMNSMRVYLHHLAWELDPEGFKNRMERYLSISDRHGISTLFVFFDDCWDPTYKPGKQPAPEPGVHNSGWVRDPGEILTTDTALVLTLEKYVKDVMTRFKNDRRIVLWDLYNDPGNNNLKNTSMDLLQKAFKWGREINPSQPLSAGIWNKELVDLNHYQLENSDVITYHNYSDKTEHKKWIDSLRSTGRPLICTEYMARTRNSLIKDITPMLREENIGAYNWGLVAGKTNTIYAWDTPMPDGKEPKVWFHDIFRKDGTPFDKRETELIRRLTAKTVTN